METNEILPSASYKISKVLEINFVRVKFDVYTCNES